MVKVSTNFDGLGIVDLSIIGIPVLILDEPAGVAVRDVFDGFSEKCIVVGELPGLDPCPHPGAEQAAEYLVPYAGKVAAGVGDHADEAPEQPVGGDRLELALDPGAVVVEPPGGAELELSGDAILGKRSQQAAHHFVIGGVKRIENRARQRTILLHRIEKPGEYPDVD